MTFHYKIKMWCVVCACCGRRFGLVFSIPSSPTSLTPPALSNPQQMFIEIIPIGLVQRWQRLEMDSVTYYSTTLRIVFLLHHTLVGIVLFHINRINDGDGTCHGKILFIPTPFWLGDKEQGPPQIAKTLPFSSHPIISSITPSLTLY